MKPLLTDNGIAAEPKSQRYDVTQRKLILEMIAHMKTPREIQRDFKKLYDIDLPYQSIVSLRNTKRSRQFIADERERFLVRIEDVPGYHKRVRMERREFIYETALVTGDYKSALTAVKHQEEEIETKNRGNNYSLTLNQYNNLNDDELEARRQDLMKTITIKPKLATPKES